LSGLALATRPALLVWPESAMPGLSEADYRAVQQMVISNRVWMVFGADDVEPGQASGPGAAGGKTPDRYFNAAFLLAPDGRVAARYRKQRLVIFGEYVPLVRWLPFVKYLTPIEGGFTPGDGPVGFGLGDLQCRGSVLICFEDVFPDLVRRHAADGVDFLLNLTNNGWFGESAAQWQQAACAVFRAVENGLPLIRWAEWNDAMNLAESESWGRCCLRKLTTGGLGTASEASIAFRVTRRTFRKHWATIRISAVGSLVAGARP